MSFSREGSKAVATLIPPVAPDLPRCELYVSADVETDGPIPGEYSLLSFAFVEVGTFDGRRFERGGGRAFYRELRPISVNFQPEALEKNGLNRVKLMDQGLPPEDAMNEAGDWTREVSAGCRPVMVAYPAVFDWMWLFWYFTAFSRQGSPFGFADCLDIKTLIAANQHGLISNAKPRLLPDHLKSDLPHTHDALDDAREQAEIFAAVFSANLDS